MPIEWSVEIPFVRGEINAQVPCNSGVYQILQSEEYSRYNAAIDGFDAFEESYAQHGPDNGLGGADRHAELGKEVDGSGHGHDCDQG